MKIGIDGTPLAIDFFCGTRNYAEGLLWALAKIDKKNEYLIFTKKNTKIPRQRNFKRVKIPSWLPILKKQVFLTHAAQKNNVDVFFYLIPFGSVFFQHSKIVTTIHDIDLKKIFPKPKSPRDFFHVIYVNLLRSQTIRKSHHFTANSHFTKRQLVAYLKKNNLKRQATVIHHAINPRFREIKRIKTPKKKFFLCMGDFSPRKNVPRIIEAYAILPKSTRNIYHLKIVISTNNLKNQLLKIINNLDIKKHVKIEEAVKLSSLVRLYNQATLFLYPSLYEGFGLPLLEAMACGCPVITSNLGATKETAGEAAYLVNPSSTTQIKRAILNIVSKPKLANKLRRAGLTRAKQFSWEKTAKKTLEILQKVHLTRSNH